MVIHKTNMLIPFPIHDKMMELWAIEIYRQRPDVNLQDLSDIMDMFMQEKFVWDTKKGIQNIFRALKEYKQVIE